MIPIVYCKSSYDSVVIAKYPYAYVLPRQKKKTMASTPTKHLPRTKSNRILVSGYMNFKCHLRSNVWGSNFCNQMPRDQSFYNKCL